MVCCAPRMAFCIVEEGFFIIRIRVCIPSIPPPPAKHHSLWIVMFRIVIESRIDKRVSSSKRRRRAAALSRWFGFMGFVLFNSLIRSWPLSTLYTVKIFKSRFLLSDGCYCGGGEFLISKKRSTLKKIKIRLGARAWYLTKLKLVENLII